MEKRCGRLEKVRERLAKKRCVTDSKREYEKLGLRCVKRDMCERFEKMCGRLEKRYMRNWD